MRFIGRGFEFCLGAIAQWPKLLGDALRLGRWPYRFVDALAMCHRLHLPATGSTQGRWDEHPHHWARHSFTLSVQTITITTNLAWRKHTSKTGYVVQRHYYYASDDWVNRRVLSFGKSFDRRRAAMRRNTITSPIRLDDANQCSACASGGRGQALAPRNKICPLARGLARHNQRFTIEEIIKIVATRCQI